MALHAASWPSLDQEPMTSTAGDVGATEPQDQPRHASLSLDQQAADILKLFGQETGDCNDTDSMDFDAFTFQDPNSTQFGALDDSVSTSATAMPNSFNTTSSCDNHIAIPAYGSWSTIPGPPTFGYEQTAFQPGPWLPGTRFEQSHGLGFNGGQGLGIHMPPTLSPVEGSSAGFHSGLAEQSSPMEDYDGPESGNGWRQAPVPPAEDIFADDGDEDGADSAEPCYAQLLYKCLKEAPHHMLSLRELYEWVAHHSAKAKDPTNRGWQNSVRHNLSMNAAFQRVTGATAGKKGSLWRLTDEALRDGVISTTRYRKDPKRKPERRTTPAPNRQLSGAKGGRATRDASRLRQHQQQRMHGFPSSRHFRRPDRHHHDSSPQYSPYSSRSTPHSPQPFLPHLHQPYHHPIPHSAPTSQPSSPYFNIADPNPPPHDLTAHGLPFPTYTPNVEESLPLDPSAKPPSSAVSGFEFMPLDLSQVGLFGDHDPELMRGVGNPDTPTPSLMTEGSFLDEEIGAAF